MNPGATYERVFDALKRHILSGDVLPGERLEPATFAERFNSSVTPVRDALHRLAGERLLETRASEGFYIPLVTEPALRDLYVWNAELVRLCIRGWPRNHANQAKANDLPVDIARATARFFELFAVRSTNREHGYQIDLANDRLGVARVAEQKVLSDLECEIRLLALAFDNNGTAELAKTVANYHRRRLQATPMIVRAIYA